MSDHIMDAAIKAYEFASDLDAPSQHGLRAAVRRALEIQREEIAEAIRARADVHRDQARAAERPDQRQSHVALALGLDEANVIAREHGKES